MIADWGNKRTYIVSDVDFEKNPETHTFCFNGKDTKISDYFQKVYDKTLKDFNQPLFKIQVSDEDYFLPPEFCLIDGVPDSIRKSAGMRDALAKTRVTPQEKIDKIQNMCDLLMQQKAVKNWGLEIEQVPISLTSTVLSSPQIFSQNQVIQVNESTLRRLPIHKAVDLQQGEWVMIYQNPQQSNKRSFFNQADKVLNTFIQACNQLKIKV